ncbi:hypothetical protein G7Y89_g1995 [Cudoniella acicularis]|uniref:Uncharacterized protein n=1 Tax=Cudoniella acicularis TaxID=354080 RepID=A0A8H4RU89_9HELO|nr:hypothetical protein G7Y89_g1995 [Cudoniella acicularis]
MSGSSASFPRARHADDSTAAPSLVRQQDVADSPCRPRPRQTSSKSDCSADEPRITVRIHGRPGPRPPHSRTAIGQDLVYQICLDSLAPSPSLLVLLRLHASPLVPLLESSSGQRCQSLVRSPIQTASSKSRTLYLSLPPPFLPLALHVDRAAARTFFFTSNFLPFRLSSNFFFPPIPFSLFPARPISSLGRKPPLLHSAFPTPRATCISSIAWSQPISSTRLYSFSTPGCRALSPLSSFNLYLTGISEITWDEPHLNIISTALQFDSSLAAPTVFQMPPTLDLSLAKKYAHADMILSSRNSPRLNLRRATPYGIEKAPLSSTSSRFSFNHLIASPPPSPSLPALVPRHGKPPPTSNPRKYLRVLMWVSGVLLILYFGFTTIQLGHSVKPVGWATNSGEEFEMVGDTELPDFPTPVMITDKRGRAKWTVSIPPDHEFPLQPEQYRDICTQNTEVAIHVADLHKHIHIEHAAHHGYYHVDPYFMDVAEAEAHGLLPGLKAKTSMNVKEGALVGENTDGLIVSDVCKQTMTFVLETHDAGLGKTLMMLWTAYGLAQKEGRDFFVDDSRWAYGKYTKFFKPPPIPKCRPPPRHEMLPCPHHARHLVVSAATAGYTFGGAFNEVYEDPRKMEVYRQKPMYEFARQGFEALFQLSNDDEEYVDKRILELHSKTLLPAEEATNGVVVGIHVRHGDRRPYEFQYKDSYVPLDRYSDKAHELIHKTFNNSGPDGGQNLLAEEHSLILIASDDPEVYEAEEFKEAIRAQEQIRLAGKQPAGTPKPSGIAGMRNFVDETVGWEGGFFAGMFWSLGKPSSVPANAVEPPDTNLPPTEEALRLRELVGRAYLMDLAVLGQASDKVVCTVSSMGCKLLAVMMGWEKAIERGGFVNIDGDFEWRGVSW